MNLHLSNSYTNEHHLSQDSGGAGRREIDLEKEKVSFCFPLGRDRYGSYFQMF